MIMFGSLALGIININKIGNNIQSKIVTAVDKPYCYDTEYSENCRVKVVDEHGDTYFVVLYNDYDVVKDETFTAYDNSITEYLYLTEDAADRSASASVILNFCLFLISLIGNVILFKKIIKAKEE